MNKIQKSNEGGRKKHLRKKTLKLFLEKLIIATKKTLENFLDKVNEGDEIKTNFELFLKKLMRATKKQAKKT